jgi:hypothetical protein
VSVSKEAKEHHHEELERCKFLNLSTRSFIKANCNFHVMTLYNEIQKRKLSDDMNPCDLKKKISYSKWYSKRKEKERNKEKDGDSLEDLKQLLDFQRVNIRDINMDYLFRRQFEV